jgi:hypothetical protein
MLSLVSTLALSYLDGVAMSANMVNTTGGGIPREDRTKTDPFFLKTGAVCLDGTPAGFYFSPAVGSKNTNDWQLYFEGGGWCYDEEDCLGRSGGNLGSSKGWPASKGAGGIMDSDCANNPDFCNFNRVYMAYCDGNSFSGNRDQPVMVGGKPLYFRGRRIIDAVISYLMENHNLGAAENVLLTGCSAGGLATYLHTDYVGDTLKAKVSTIKKYKAASISGFFLLHNTVEDKPVYPTEMKYIFNLANSTHGVNDACIAAQQPGDEWKCNFAEEAYAHTHSPTFPLNSALDSWQTGCIYTSELAPNFPNQTGFENGVCSSAPGWAACARNPESCTQSQIKEMNQYIADFETKMNTNGAATYTKPGNGAFIHSCHTHCEAQSGAWNSFKVNGVSMQQAVSGWWNSDGTDPASKHSYTPCSYKDGATGPRKCNPTC